MRALKDLPGCVARFLPCDVGADHGKLRHVGWEGSGHELTSRPRETSSVKLRTPGSVWVSPALGDGITSGFTVCEVLQPAFSCSATVMEVASCWCGCKIGNAGSEEVCLVSVDAVDPVSPPVHVSSLEELEAVGWKELEVLGREHAGLGSIRARPSGWKKLRCFVQGGEPSDKMKRHLDPRVGRGTVPHGGAQTHASWFSV